MEKDYESHYNFEPLNLRNPERSIELSHIIRVVSNYSGWIHSVGISGIGRVKFLQVLFPLHGQQLFFGIVAFFAARHDIASGALSAPGNGYNVIHGQLCRWS